MASSSASSLRQQARRLWNECSRLARSNESNNNIRRFSSDTASTSSSSSPSSSSSSLSSSSSSSSKASGSSVPGVALLLGAAGAAPFVALAPQVEPHVPAALLPSFVRENAAALQVGYGVAIASFLGGIHWGLAATGAAWGARKAMATTAATTAATAAAARSRPLPSSSPSAASSSATAARYLWSVTPCLLAWPATALMGRGKGNANGNEKSAQDEAGASRNEARAALLAAATLAVALAADAAFASRGLLPPYLMKLRVPLSFAAVGGLGLRAVDARNRSERK